MKDKTLLKKIGNNIQIARLKKNITQDALADKCGISSKHISAIERGVSAGSIPLIIDICNLLEVSPNYIFGDTIDNSNNAISVIPDEVYVDYLKLNEDNKKFVQNTIKHLCCMQKIGN